MNFELTAEQKEFQQRVREFATRVLPREYARECEEEDEYPFNFWEQMSQAGYAGLLVPTEYGGSGCGAMEVTLFLEELGRQFMVSGMWYMVGIIFPVNVLKAIGTEEQKRQYFPKLAKGEIRFCFSLTEPSGGSDILSLTSFAAEKGDEFILNGEKTFTTAADVADYLIVIARTKKRDEVAKVSQGLSMFIVPKDTPGISLRKLEKIGWRGLHTYQVFYDDVRVPASNLLGEKDMGWQYAALVLNVERSSGGLLLGQAEAAFEYALNYAKQRYAFGKPIGQFQSIQHQLANMYIQLETMRMWSYKVAWMVDQGMNVDVEAAMALLVINQVQRYITMNGMDIMGGHGVIKDHDMERFYRQSLSLGLPNTMLRNVVGRYGLGLPRSY